jgi:hypothetical protein
VSPLQTGAKSALEQRQPFLYKAIPHPLGTGRTLRPGEKQMNCSVVFPAHVKHFEVGD